MNRRDALTALGASAAIAATGCEAKADGHAAGAGRESSPANNFHLYLCAFHIAKKNPAFVVEAHHYCSSVAEDVHQCVIFDSNSKNARILGVEYIISDAIYRKLPAEEKKFYHPHSYEIISGLLVAPDLDDDAEQKLLSGLVTSWGKTWHTWPDPSTALPMGEPLLMWSATRDGQISDELLADRDRKMKISTPAKRKRRSVFGPVPQIDPPKSLESLGRQFTNEGPDVPPAKK
jgi:Protein of unknown function (DUF1264)